LPGVKERWSSGGRGVAIAVFIGLYAWFMRQPEGSFTASLLVGAAVQILVLALRKFVPADRLPQAMYVFEYLADGVSVLMFALGVFGGIANVSSLA
jgi:hypothetical protein